jgi:hypothetical protein
MACTACLVCFVSAVSGRSKNALGRRSANSGDITKLEQSRFSFDIYEFKRHQEKHLFKLAVKGNLHRQGFLKLLVTVTHDTCTQPSWKM